MNITLRPLKAFTQTARLGSFTRAAEQMHITQAGLSIMMRELETQMGCRLFDRTTRLLSLTAAGEKSGGSEIAHARQPRLVKCVKSLPIACCN